MLADQVDWQRGEVLSRRLYPRGGVHRLTFVRMAAHFLANEISTTFYPLAEDSRKQRLLAATVRTIGSENPKHGPEQLARFVVAALRKLENSPGKLKSSTHHQQFIRRQLRLPDRLNPKARRTARRFNRVLEAVVERDELRNKLLSLLHSGGENVSARQILKRNLTALFRHAAAMHKPSKEATVEDIRRLNHAELHELSTESPRYKSPTPNVSAVEKQLNQFRTKRGLNLPSANGDVEKGKSFDVLDRRVRAKLRKRYGA